MKNKGFSMVELIIVIAIMAILSGFLAPALVRYINKSRLSADIDTGRTLATALMTSIVNEAVRDDAEYHDTPYKVSDMGGSLFKAAVSDIIPIDEIEGKAQKDVDGNDFPSPGCFYYALDPEKNKVQVYYGGDDEDYMIYPQTGSKLIK